MVDEKSDNVAYQPRRSTGALSPDEPRGPRWWHNRPRMSSVVWRLLDRPENVARGALQGLMVVLVSSLLLMPFTHAWSQASYLVTAPMTYVLMRRYRAGAGRFGVRGVPVVLVLLGLQLLGALTVLRLGNLVQTYGWSHGLVTFSGAPFADLLVDPSWNHWLLVSVAGGAFLGLFSVQTLLKAMED